MNQCIKNSKIIKSKNFNKTLGGHHTSWNCKINTVVAHQGHLQLFLKIFDCMHFIWKTRSNINKPAINVIACTAYESMGNLIDSKRNSKRPNYLLNVAQTALNI